MKDIIWNPWHGCVKWSEGCRNCYVYRRDTSVGRDASNVARTKTFSYPLAKDRSGAYKVSPGASVFCCMTSDFFLDAADPWREEIWDIIRTRSDVHFSSITKRITRFSECIPADWGEGWDNVTICCTVENQRAADERLPLFLSLPIRKKNIVCEPLLSPIHMEQWLGPKISLVIAGGESGLEARPCDYAWILDIRRQCADAGVSFWFKQTGARLIKDGRMYRIRRQYQHSQARRAGINYTAKRK